MSVVVPFARPSVEIDMPDERRHRKELARVLNLVARGWMNVALFVTLDPGVATTTVIDARISAQTAAILCPTSANAAAAIPTTWVTCTNGEMVIHHANNGQTNRTFTVGLIG